MVEKKITTEELITMNIGVLMKILEDSTIPAKVRVQASLALIEWQNKRKEYSWGFEE